MAVKSNCNYLYTRYFNSKKISRVGHWKPFVKTNFRMQSDKKPKCWKFRY